MLPAKTLTPPLQPTDTSLPSHLIEETLLCQSPQQLITLLRTHLTTTDPQLPTTPLRILDIGAGNGRVGLELRRQFRATAPPIARLVGTDLLESAKLAALRDRRPCPFDEYVVADLTQRTVVERFKAERFNVVTICAALGDGDGDLPLRVVDAAVEVLGEGGVLAFTVNGSVGVEGEGRERFGGFLESVRGEGVGEGTHWGGVREIGRRRYRHRLSVKGEWIEYLALVYRKVGEVNGVVDGKN